MKKSKILTLALLLILSISLFASVSAAVTAYRNGDVNGDGTINLKDVTQLRRVLADGDVSTDAVVGNPDVNGDGAVNLKDVTTLQRYLAGGWDVELPETPAEEPSDPLAEDLSQYEVLSSKKSESGILCTAFRTCPDRLREGWVPSQSRFCPHR